jgi:hypothetical protein
LLLMPSLSFMLFCAAFHRIEYILYLNFEPCFLFRWLRSCTLRPGTLLSFTHHPRGVRVLKLYRFVSHHPIYHVIFPLPGYEMKTHVSRDVVSLVAACLPYRRFAK